FAEFAARRPGSAFAHMTDGAVHDDEWERERIAAMDEAGIDVANLSIPYVDIETLVDRVFAVEFVSRTNDALIETARLHPSRLNAIVSLPLPFTEECLDELERIGGDPTVVGAIVQCH